MFGCFIPHYFTYFTYLESEWSCSRMWLSLLTSSPWGLSKSAAVLQQACVGLHLSTVSLWHAFSPLRSSGVSVMCCITYSVFHWCYFWSKLCELYVSMRHLHLLKKTSSAQVFFSIKDSTHEFLFQFLTWHLDYESKTIIWNFCYSRSLYLKQEAVWDHEVCLFPLPPHSDPDWCYRCKTAATGDKKRCIVIFISVNIVTNIWGNERTQLINIYYK